MNPAHVLLALSMMCGLHAGEVSITGLLPDPEGPDPGFEQVRLGVASEATIDLAGWCLVDRDGNRFRLAGTLGGEGEVTLLLEDADLTLTNTGDQISLLDATGDLVHMVSYSRGDVIAGEWLDFQPPEREETEPPTELGAYYRDAAGKSGEALKAALHQIVRGGHQGRSYGEVWDLLRETDQHPDDPDSVIGFYTRRAIPKSDRDRGNTCPDCWNREHIWSKSHGFRGSRQIAHNDGHHLRASDKSTNADRGSLDFDEGGEPHPEAEGARWKRGTSWEPPDVVKGDVARMMFYMAVRYEGDSGVPDLELVDRVGTRAPKFGKLCTLLAWHEADPPDDSERRRNDLVFDFQGNRNPFIDHPEFAAAIFGNQCGR